VGTYNNSIQTKEINMSCLANEELLEGIFEDLLLQIEEAGFDPHCEDAQYVAGVRAQQILEEMG
jgi:hypothetical protein